MAGSQNPRQSRTVIEVVVISIIIYVLLGMPGVSTLISQNSQESSQSVPKTKLKLDNLVHPAKDLLCEEHDYRTHIFSASPLVIYIEDFLSDAEANHLVTLSNLILLPSHEKWTPSTVVNQNVVVLDSKVRKSEKAAIERDDTVQCIEARALAFQGWPKATFIERLWTQIYNVSGHYGPHYDWASATKTSRRVSSFMVYLKDECEGGGTNFPRLAKPKEREWCQFIECDDESTEGVTFRAKTGSAVFWMNFDAEGRGLKDTIHAGMPVKSGQKIGLNIWSWYQAGHSGPENAS